MIYFKEEFPLHSADEYEARINRELRRWRMKITKTPGIVERSSRKFSRVTNNIIPEKVHGVITAAVKGMVHASLFTAKYLSAKPPLSDATLEQRDLEAKAVISRYKRLASAEGAGTGAGGIMLGLADFPALLAIKMKMLFELAGRYGFHAEDERERMFLLIVFQLAFSGHEQRMNALRQIDNWQQMSRSFSSGEDFYDEMNWRSFQQEYRDSIDFRKMLQLVPGIGAVVGAWANYNLVEDLGETAMNCYRTRILSDH